MEFSINLLNDIKFHINRSLYKFLQILINFDNYLKMPRTTMDAALGLFISPLQVYRRKGCENQLFICLALTLTIVGQVLYCFYLEGVKSSQNVLALFCPPVAVALNKGCNKYAWMCLVMTLLGWFPGVIYAYMTI